MAIDVEEPQRIPGTTIVCALVGPDADMFAINVDGGQTYYTVNRVVVSREVYMDALRTSKEDQTPRMPQEEDDAECTCGQCVPQQEPS